MARNKSALRRVKDEMFGPKSHELLLFCFFLVLSFCFWLLQSLNETLERDVNVYVELRGIPEDVAIIDSLPSSISVTLRDRGLTLARHSLSSLFRSNQIKVDFASYDTGQKEAEVVIAQDVIQRMLRRVFPASTKIQSIHPDTLRFAYNHGNSRVVPVKLAGTLKALPQHYIQGVSFEPDFVRVYAPQAVLDTLSAVYAEASFIDELDESGEYQVTLCKIRSRRCEPNQVRLNVAVGYYTEKTVSVPVIGLNFPANKKLGTIPSHVSVTFKVESGLYDKITSDDFLISTTYEDLLRNASGDGPHSERKSKLQLRLKSNPPQGVSNVRISPPEVDFLIEERNLEED